MASASFFEASLGLADCSPPAVRSHSITPKAAGLATPLPLSHVLPAELASCASVFFPVQSATSGWILARLLDEERCVELRWLSMVQEEAGELDMTLDTAPGLYNELDRQAATPPVRFVFADPLLPNIHIAEIDKQIVCHVLSKKGVLTRLTFPPRQFFLSSELEDEVSGDYALSTLSGRTPVLFHGISDDVALVACSDGSLISIRRTAALDEHWQETDLNITSGLWPVRALLPTRFSTRNLAAIANAAESPSQVVSVASLVGGTDVPFDLSYTLSRDFKLRVWQNHTICARTIDLAPSSNALLGPEPRNLLRATLVEDDAEYSAFLVVAIDTRFLLYGVPRSKRRDTELRQIGVQGCPVSYSMAELRDLQIVKVNPASAAPEQDWVLWTLWERANAEPLIAFTELAKAGSDVNETWTHVRAPEANAWNADYFDDLLAADVSRSTSDVFMEHVFGPGRYSAETIFAAIQKYADAYREIVTDRAALYALSRDDHDSLAEQVADIVGCTLVLEISAENGQPLHAQFESRLRTEWLRFTSLCNEIRAVARFPLALAADTRRQLVMAFTRDTVVAPVQAEHVTALEVQAFAPEDEEDISPSGFVQAMGPIQEAIRTLIRAAKLLADNLAPSQLKAFEHGVLSANRTTRRVPHDETAYTLFEDHIENNLSDDFFDDLLPLVTPMLPHFGEAFEVLLSSDQGAAAGAGNAPATEFALGLTAAGAMTASEERYQSALRQLVLLVYLASDAEVASPIAQGLLPRAFAFVHGLYVLRWLAHQPAPPLKARDHVNPDDSGSLTSRLGGLSVGNLHAEEPSIPTPAISLFGLLARFRLPANVTLGDVSTKMLAKLSEGLIEALALLTFQTVECDPTLVKFFVDSSLCTQALCLCDLYAVEEAGVLFAKGLALLGMERLAEAQEAFERGAAGLADESASLALVLPADIWESPERSFLYYRLCALLFKAVSYAAGTASLAQLALRARTNASSRDSGVDVEDLARSLQQEIFEAYIALQQYDEAYATLMTLPDIRMQETCLRILVVSMSENGQGEALLRFSFANLEQQLADHLDYRSRHAKFGSLPDYHQMAYAYHLSRGNYKDAAAVMLRRVRQLDFRAIVERAAFNDVARERCRSYLAVINCLSLVDKDDAWLTVPVADTVEDVSLLSEGKRRQTLEGSSLPASKRRRLASGRHVVVDHIPDDEHAPSLPRIDVVSLDMLREEYALALAKLSLASSFPELARTDIEIDPEGVVALYAEKGETSTAFSVAQTLDADMTMLFERLVDRCVQLSRGDTFISERDTDWLNSLDEAASLEGNFASRSWHVLRLHLDRYDRPDGRYRVVVLRKALATDRMLRLPLWLSAYFAERDPDSLLRALIAHDRLDEALEQGLGMVQKAFKLLSAGHTAKTAFLRLPYPLLDQLLQVQLPHDETEVAARHMQTQLGSSLRDLLVKIDKQSDAHRSQNRNAEYARASQINGYTME